MCRPDVLRRTLLALALACLGHALHAQGVGSVTGTVVDDSGAALPGVTLALEPAAGGAAKTAQSGPDGRYTFPDASPGRYRVVATLDGFDTSTVEVQVVAGPPASVDVRLQIASFFDNVTVSPQKREEQILDVPAAITAVTGGDVERRGITNLKDLAATVPSLSIVETGPGSQRAQIRGISSPLNLPTIGLYVDEAPVNLDAVGAGLDMRLLDLERVEVLRGPQGTLYGEGAMGGTIKYVTRDPALDRPTFQFDGTLGAVADGTSTYRGSMVANVPVVKGAFGLRFVAGTEHSPGWVDYPALGETDVNGGDSQTFRVKGLWIASQRASLSAMFQYQNSEYDGQTYAEEDRTAPYLLDQPRHSTSKLTNVVFKYDAGPVTVLSSTGYLARNDEGTNDFSAIYVPLFPLFGFPPGTVKTVANLSESEARIFTEEVRLASTGSGRLGWTAGVYFRHYDSDGSNVSQTTPNPLPFEIQTLESSTTSKQVSVFGEANYDVTDKVSATLGLRWFRDRRETGGATGIFAPPTPNTPQEATFDSVDPRFVLSFRPAEGRLIYASAAKGFRSGGFNGPLPCSIPSAFEPESLWTYEVGSSLSVSRGRFVVQGSVYRNDWQDIQTLTLCPNVPVRATDNSGKASGTGVDLQFTITPVRPLRLTVSANVNRSEYDTTSLAHLEGDRIDYVPDYTLGLAADWSFKVAGEYASTLHVDYQQTGEFTVSIRNLGVPPFSSEVVSGLNARLAVVVGAAEFSVFGQNLLDDNSAVQPAIPPGGVLSAVRPQPRTLGAGIGVRF